MSLPSRGLGGDRRQNDWPPPVPPDDDDLTVRKGRRSLWPIKFALVAMLAGAIYLALNARGDEAADPGPAGPQQQATNTTTAEELQPASPSSTDVAPPQTASGDAGDESDDTTQSQPATASVTSIPIRGVLTNAQITLEGEVPSDEHAQSLVTLLESVVGVGNVTETLTVDPAAPEATQMSLLVADEIVFGVGSVTIEPEFLPILDQVVDFMNLDPNITVIVEGHTDSRGDQILNLALSQQRADAVVDYVASRGINKFRLEPRGRGNTEPLGDESTIEGRRQNRRIEFDIKGFRLDPGE